MPSSRRAEGRFVALLGPRALLVVAWVIAVASLLGCTRAPAQPNLVLIVVDTLRADHLGSYGYARAQTPRLDAFAAGGTRFSGAHSTCSWTLPSVASILTGRYPSEHRAERLVSVLSDKQVTIAEMLDAAGYEAAAFSANAAVVIPETGFAQGFARFDVLDRRGEQSGPDPVWTRPGRDHADPDATADVVTDAALAWVSSRTAPSRPYFLYVHYFDPHASYSPPEAYAARFGVRPDDPLRGPAQALATVKAPKGKDLETVVALYDAEIAFTDHEIGRLLDGLGVGRSHDTVVIVTADHGEEFADHGGIQHGRTLYEELLHVPLFVAGGDVAAGRVVDTPVSLISLLPTLAELAKTEPPPGLVGRSLVPELRGAASAPQPIFADLPAGAIHRAAAIDGSWKLVLTHAFVPALYDLARDPRETAKENDREGARVMAMQKVLGDHNKAGFAASPEARAGQRSLDADRRERLRQLGYIE